MNPGKPADWEACRESQPPRGDPSFRTQALVNAHLCVDRGGWHSRAPVSRFLHTFNSAARAQLAQIVFSIQRLTTAVTNLVNRQTVNLISDYC